MKLPATLYRGIEFVRIEDLPINQRKLLQLSPDFPERIKILMDSKMTGECLLYAAYTSWYSTVYNAKAIHEPQAVRQHVTPESVLVLNKA
jgi:hypothetical protein